jgi:flagellar biosynthesis/type III secretory pathway protein FliH
MKSNEGSHVTSSCPASHRFPDFAEGGRIYHTETNTGECDQFQPLFNDASACSTHPASDDRTTNGENQMEHARERGYQRGFKAGRQDACQMANNLLAPHADLFQQNLERLASYQQNIADHASTHMIKLAVAIAECIMGADAHVTVADLQDLRQTLIEAICKRHELHLRYHPEDLANLQHLMECNGEDKWRMAFGLNIAEDLNVPKGAMSNGRDAEKSPSIEGQVQPSLQQLLNKAEQARKP